MMRKCLFSMLMLGSLSQTCAEGKMWITSVYKGKIYESCLSAEQFKRMPVWDPFGAREMPLSPGKAIQLARSTFEEVVPKNERSNWLLKHVELKAFDVSQPYERAGPKKWYYIVHFWDKRNPVFAEPTPAITRKHEVFHLIVPMDGECCKLVATTRRME